MFELRDLERFVAIVEYRNFGRAAAALGIAQPVLSRVIARLEHRLAVALFSRERRQVALTPAGELFAREAYAVIAQARAAERAMADVARGRHGALRLGTRTSARFTTLPAAVRRLHEEHPQMSVLLSQPLVPMHIEQVVRGIIDMTIIRGPVTLAEGLRRDVLRADDVVAVLPDDHRLAQHSTIELADLAGEPFIELGRFEAIGYHDVIRGMCAQAGFIPHSVEEVDSVDGVVVCVAAGNGVALLHDARVDLPLKGVVYRRIAGATQQIELAAIWRKDDRNAVIKPFLSALRDVSRYDVGWSASG
jgi:DNA-binding transcriptional LysR family regulator